MELAREDIVLIGLTALLVGTVVWMVAGDQLLGSPEPDSEIAAYCQDVATAIEQNSSVQGASCDCIPPGSFDPERYTSAPELDNVTELFLVECGLPNGQDVTFPIRRVNNESVAEQVNTTVGSTE